MALLLQRRRSTEAIQTLHDIWPSSRTLHIHSPWLLPLGEFCHTQNLLCVQVFRSFVTARHSSSGRQPNLAACYKEWNNATFVHIFGWAAITLGIGTHSSSSSYFLLFFLAYSEPSHIECLPYFHIWCGLSADLHCRSEVCCTRLAENTGRKNRKKIAISVPSHNFVGLYLWN